MQHGLQMLAQIGIWGIWRPGQHLGSFIVFLKLFLSSVWGVSGHSVLLRGHCYRVVLWLLGGVWIGGLCQVVFTWKPAPKVFQQNIRYEMISVIHIIIIIVSGFNVVADWCMYIHYSVPEHVCLRDIRSATPMIPRCLHPLFCSERPLAVEVTHCAF